MDMCCDVGTYLMTSSPLTVQFISEVYNIEEIKKKQVLLTVDGAKSIFTGILYAYLTHFHITGADNTIVSYKWLVLHLEPPLPQL